VLESADFFLNQADQSDPENLPDTTNLSETEKILVRRVVEKYGGNISKAAKELGLTRASLYRRIEKYGL
jgi:two-component system, NtrC family, response regulator HydG